MEWFPKWVYLSLREKKHSERVEILNLDYIYYEKKGELLCACMVVEEGGRKGHV